MEVNYFTRISPTKEQAQKQINTRLTQDTVDRNEAMYYVQQALQKQFGEEGPSSVHDYIQAATNAATNIQNPKLRSAALKQLTQDFNKLTTGTIKQGTRRSFSSENEYAPNGFDYTAHIKNNGQKLLNMTLDNPVTNSLLGATMLTNPLIAGTGIAGASATDAAVKAATNNYQGWGDLISQNTGINPELAEWTNPGFLIGGAKPIRTSQSLLGSSLKNHGLLGGARKAPLYFQLYNDLNKGNLKFNPVPNLEVDNSYNKLWSFKKPQNSPSTSTTYKFDPRLSIEHLPGYMIKSLMSGSPLEKQISQDGSISINSLKQWISKSDIAGVDRELLTKVLQNHQGEKAINYNTLKKEVQALIPKYDRVPQSKYEDYGVERLGYDSGRSSDIFALQDRPEFQNRYQILQGYDGPQIFRRQDNIFDPLEEVLPEELDSFAAEYVRTHPGEFENHFPNLKTFTFESPGIVGNTNHYEGNPLGHSRTYTSVEEPDILHVMESQSDWAQHPLKLTPEEVKRELEKCTERIAHKKKEVEDYERLLQTGIRPDGSQVSEQGLYQLETDLLPYIRQQLQRYEERQRLLQKSNLPIEKHLQDTYLRRQLQENLRFAAEASQTKMRYPTPETAAKIEGYNREYPREVTRGGGFIDQLSNLTAKLRETYNTENLNNEQETQLFKTVSPEYLRVLSLIEEAPFDYPPQHQTILKKYQDFPKQYQKLFKGSEVRTVTDPRGNTWYEVDVPENYLNSEWQFKLGGKMKKRIHIKQKNRGKFTASAKAHGKGVQEYARSVVNDPNATTLQKRRAQFALNAKKWSH